MEVTLAQQIAMVKRILPKCTSFTCGAHGTDCSLCPFEISRTSPLYCEERRILKYGTKDRILGFQLWLKEVCKEQLELDFGGTP